MPPQTPRVSLELRQLRATEVEFDETADRFIREAAKRGTMRLIANHPDERNTREYLVKEREEREASNIPPGDPVLFLEVTVADASEFAPAIQPTLRTGTEAAIAAALAYVGQGR